MKEFKIVAIETRAINYVVPADNKEDALVNVDENYIDSIKIIDWTVDSVAEIVKDED
jgi:hypothetical protein